MAGATPVSARSEHAECGAGAGVGATAADADAAAREGEGVMDMPKPETPRGSLVLAAILCGLALVGAGWILKGCVGG